MKKFIFCVLIFLGLTFGCVFSELAREKNVAVANSSSVSSANFCDTLAYDEVDSNTITKANKVEVKSDITVTHIAIISALVLGVVVYAFVEDYIKGLIYKAKNKIKSKKFKKS